MAHKRIPGFIETTRIPDRFSNSWIAHCSVSELRAALLELYAAKMGGGGRCVYEWRDARSEEIFKIAPPSFNKGRMVSRRFKVYQRNHLLIKTPRPGTFLSCKCLAINVCAFFIEASSVMSSCTGTTVEEEWTSNANLASPSSAAANLQEPTDFISQSRVDTK
jgi:hypothetical protein